MKVTVAELSHKNRQPINWLISTAIDEVLIAEPGVGCAEVRICFHVFQLYVPSELSFPAVGVVFMFSSPHIYWISVVIEHHLKLRLRCGHVCIRADTFITCSHMPLCTVYTYTVLEEYPVHLCLFLVS